MQDGEPISWRHFVYGTRHLARHYARESLRLAGVRMSTATGMGSTPKNAREVWIKRMTVAAGWG